MKSSTIIHTAQVFSMYFLLTVRSNKTNKIARIAIELVEGWHAPLKSSYAALLLSLLSHLPSTPVPPESSTTTKSILHFYSFFMPTLLYKWNHITNEPWSLAFLLSAVVL
jgi:hypothetical protein